MRREEGEGPSWLGRAFVVMVGVTFVVNLIALQIRTDLFGGGATWLHTTKYIGWGERAGFSLALLLLSAASCGAWLGACYGFFVKLLRRSTFFGAMGGLGTWLLLLLLDLFTRQSITSFVGRAFELDVVLAGAGGWSELLKNTWSWFYVQIFQGLGVLILAILALIFFARRLKKTARRWGPIDRMSGRVVSVVALLANVVAVIYMTAFAQAWPVTRGFLIDETLVGWSMGWLVSSTTDFDGDGHSQFDSPPDRMPFDACCYPHAIDIPGDGVDQDTLIGDLDVSKMSAATRADISGRKDYPPVQFSNRKNVIFVLLESVRYDSLHTSIDGTPVMGHLRALIDSGRAVEVPHAYASQGYTYNSLNQLFWGGIFKGATTLLHDFESNDYATAIFSGYRVSEGDGVNVNDLHLSDVIFDPLVDPAQRGNPDPDALQARLLFPHMDQFLRAAREEPFFMFVHFIDPHFPYYKENEFVLTDGPIARSQITRDNVEKLRRVYYNQVYHVDQAIGRLMTTLEETGQDKNTLIVFMSDHGEALYDDGLHVGHGVRLDDAMTRSAMVIYNAAGELPSLMSHYHVRETLRQLLTTPPDAPAAKIVDVPGRRLFQFLGYRDVPRQWGEVSLEHGRLIYDFKRDRLIDETREVSGQMSREALGEEMYRRGEDLILAWEYLHALHRGP